MRYKWEYLIVICKSYKLKVAFEFPNLFFVYFCVGILFLALDEHVKTDEGFWNAIRLLLRLTFQKKPTAFFKYFPRAGILVSVSDLSIKACLDISAK